LSENRDEIVSYSRIETEDMLSTLGVTNENIALLSRDLLQITESINNGSGTFTMLLHDESLAYTLKKSIENLENSTENLSLAIDKIYLLLDDVDSGRGLLGKLWNDTSAFNQLEFLVSNRLAEILNNTDSVVADMDLVLKELLISGENMRYISSDLRNVVRALRHGDGTAGLLLRDSTLALQLEMIIQNLVDGTEKFDENMKALRENILLRRYFRRQEKEARKNPEE
jgi:phospholipid/cholesterol/gamma-HCH transport system substrate-binding protein